MDDQLASAVSDEDLSHIVRLAHRQGRWGDKGAWKEFLNTYYTETDSSLTDPALRERETLIAYLLSFTDREDLEFLDRVLRFHSNREALKQLFKQSPDSESPQQRLVRLTHEHQSYMSKYSFAFYDKDWVVTKLPEISTLMKSNEIIALDCQWVLCEDATYSVARVCVVDHNLQVKLDEKVNPMKPVADYRTKITGITAADLDGVSYTLADAQEFMKKLLEKGTIVVGHGLHDDLLVIDTSLVFGRFYGCQPSLGTLCKSVLGYEAHIDNAPHNCVDNACASMRLVLAEIEQRVDKEKVLEDEMAKLVMSGIPMGRKRALESEDLTDLQKLKSDKYYDPFEEFDKWVERFEEEDDNLLNVQKKEHGNLLDQFSEMLCPKKIKTDKCGDPFEESEISMEKFEEEDDNHLIEIERLEKDTRARDFQISAQDKIINNLRKDLDELKAKMKTEVIWDLYSISLEC